MCMYTCRWVEHDPMEILESVRICMTKALDKATADGHNVDNGIKAIGLTNQRETTVIWSKSSGCPLHHAIVWMDVRTSSICRSPFLFTHHSFYKSIYYTTLIYRSLLSFPRRQDCVRVTSCLVFPRTCRRRDLWVVTC